MRFLYSMVALRSMRLSGDTSILEFTNLDIFPLPSKFYDPNLITVTEPEKSEEEVIQTSLWYILTDFLMLKKTICYSIILHFITTFLYSNWIVVLDGENTI